jgi:uncharacterized protein DUF3309
MNLLVVILIILFLVGVPGAHYWGHANYGYWPGGGVGLILLILIVLALAGRL